jgi:hypothetical protein
MDSERAEHIGRDDRIPRRIVVLGILSVVVGLSLIGGAVWLLSWGGSGSESIAEAQAKLRKAGCTLTTAPATSATHVFRLDAKIDYNTSPPTNGPHYAIPALWGIYREPVSALRLVHNLEHGGIVIQYGADAARDELESLVDLYFEDPTGVVVAPLPTLGNRFALSAWVTDDDEQKRSRRLGSGHLALCHAFDDGAFSAFRDAYRFKGPERFPPASLRPGT